MLHLAYECRQEHEILGPLKSYRHAIKPGRSPNQIPPRAQIFFCIDEREESIRRAIEELEPQVETFGAAGFFGVAVNYRGLDDPQGVALCPVVVKPQHAVIERPVFDDQLLHQKRQQRRRLWAGLWQTSFIGSRTLIRGWIGTIGFGLLSLFPLLGRTLAPRRMGELYRWLEDRFLPTPSTELTIMRAEGDGQELTDQLLVGFSINEKADRVAAVLRPVGLTSQFSRLVIILGHGSTCINNPHESAYHCGACGGRRGGPNARLFAAMANNRDVRARLREIGIHIPDQTWFVGGDHDTASDQITFFDEAEIPSSHLDDLRFVRRALDAARAANALERSRRFASAWAIKSPESALLHVQERAEHLAEPRPECGHATNAMAIVGRRSLTRGLFLDRRAFLISYDPTTDEMPGEEGRSLAALLGAAGPVCAGINLEYYFSYIDNDRYGAGTKLPHNVTGLLGVMNGQSSDLRTGLPWQMVEIHEPVRLLLIVENSPEKVLRAAVQSPVVRELIENRWIRIATIDPDSGAFHIYRRGAFEPFTTTLEDLRTVASSPDWFLGKPDHL
ncbi:MAG: putative inorganic carbon transporter subunit DabA, partial [Acidobacteriota bacterium]